YLGLLGISVVFYEFTGNKIKTKIAIQDKSGLYAIWAMVELVEGRVKKSKRNIRRLDEFCCDSWGLLDTTSTQCYLKNKPYQNDDINMLLLIDGEGNGNPLQYSCLENPVDGGAWRAAVHGIEQSDTTEAT
ncbi:hypothetical protein MG293_000710, partial [Ovis ammon polii]